MNSFFNKCVMILCVFFVSASSAIAAVSENENQKADVAGMVASVAAAELTNLKVELVRVRKLVAGASASSKKYREELDKRLKALEAALIEAQKRLLDSCAAFADTTNVSACLGLKGGEHATNDKAIAALWTDSSGLKKKVVTEKAGVESVTQEEYFDSVVRSGNGRCVRKKMLRGPDKSTGAGGIVLETEEGCDDGSTAQEREVDRLDQEASKRGWITALVCVAEVGGGAGLGWAVGKAVRPGREEADGSKSQSGGVLGLAIGGSAGLLACGATVLARHGNGEDTASGYSLTPTASSGGGGFALSGSW